MPFSKTLKSSRLRLGTKRPWRSRTLTGTVTSVVSTRTTSPSDTSSGPVGSTFFAADELFDESADVVPDKVGGRSGRGSSAPAKVGALICVWVAPTRRGREFDANMGAGSGEPPSDTTDVLAGWADLSDDRTEVRAS